MARNTTSKDEIQVLVQHFTSELTTLVRHSTFQELQAVLSTFQSGTSAPSATRTVKVVRLGRSAKSASSGGKRTTEQVAQFGEALLAFIQQNPGQRGEQIALALKTDVKTMRLPMLRLIADKKVKTKGQRRGTSGWPSNHETKSAPPKLPGRSMPEMSRARSFSAPVVNTTAS